MATRAALFVTVVTVLCGGYAAVSGGAQGGPAAPGELQSLAAAVASIAGEPHTVSAAGVTRDDTLLLTIENASAFDPAGKQRRLVLVGGLEGSDDSSRVVIDAVRWFKTAAPARHRDNWTVSALPLANPTGRIAPQPYAFPPLKGFFDEPEQPGSRYVWRWVNYQVPDLLVEVHRGDRMMIRTVDASAAETTVPEASLAQTMANPSSGPGLGAGSALYVTARASDGAALMREILTRTSDKRSPLRDRTTSRISREPLRIAQLLAGRYPATAPTMNYVPAVLWAHTLKLASLTRDATLRANVLKQIEPWLTAEKPLFGDRVQLTAVGGTMIFADVARAGDAHRDAAAKLAAEGVVRAAEKAPGIPQLATGWTDDMFMATVVLVRSGAPADQAAAARLLTAYAAKLQRADGLFIHAPDAPIAWGRGNGFAALGMTEALSTFAENDAARPQVLEIYRRHMKALRDHQAPDGMWHQVVDVPGSYREFSVTAMSISAMATGIRRGWLERDYLPVVERAWRGLLAHIDEDGAVVDVCTSTGAGPTLRYYLDRPAVTGADDRGGAFALGAALDMYELRSSM